MLLSKALTLRCHTLSRRQEGNTMRPTSKISGEAREAVAVVASHLGHRKSRWKVAVGLSLQAKRDVLEQFIPEYREAQGVQKRVLLDDFTRLTGYHRTSAIWLFNHHTLEQQTTARVRQPDYGVEVEEVLVQVWNVSIMCSKQLIPSLPMFLDVLERHEHLHLTKECRSRLLSMSTAIADRLLRPHQQRETKLCSSRTFPSARLSSGTSRCQTLSKQTG